MTAPSLDSILACPGLPTLPRVAMDVLELTRDPDVQVGAIAEVVQYDPALTGKILKTVNSSYYGLSRPCGTIDRAVGLLGLDAIKTLVLGFSLTEVTGNDRLVDFDLRDFWRRSIHAAAAARHLARRVPGSDEEQAFTAALLQDIGMLAIHVAATENYLDIVGAAGGDHECLPRVENERLHFTHAEVGAGLANRWSLPPQLIEPIRLHHADGLGLEVDDEVARIVRLACRIGHVLDASDRASELDTLWTEGSDWFGLTPEEVNAVVRQTGLDATALSSLLGVEIGDAVDANRLLAAAEDARIAHSIALQQKANQLQEMNATLSRQASTDRLTGAANRGRFDEALDESFSRTASSRGRLALILVDADHFKSVNDTHGHPAGDAVLIELARRTRSVIGESGLVARYGGEEFVIILPDADLSTATRRAEEIRAAIGESPFDVSGTGAQVDRLEVTVSLGVAGIDHAKGIVFSSARRLIECADKALYAAKNDGRNCTRVIRPRSAAA